MSDDDLTEGQQRLFSDPEFVGDYSRLVDGTEITEFAVTADTVRALATSAVERGLRKAALISNKTDWVDELMRMYEEETSPPAEVMVHQNTEKALQWLATSIKA